MPFPLNPADKQRYKNYTYDGASRSWKQDFIYQEQLDFGNEDGKLNSSDIPVYNSPGETVHEYIIDSVSLTKEQTIDGIKTFSSNPISTAAQSVEVNSLTRRDFVTTLDAQNVKITGDQTIANVKTFTSNPISSAAQSTAVDSLTRRDFVTTLDAQNVKISGTQSIAGTKTFTSNPISSAAQSTAVDSLTRRDFVTTLDAQNVKISGAQTIADVKTFTSNPISSAVQSTSTNSLTRRDFVTGLDAQNVKLTGDQTIAGAKTFTDDILVSTKLTNANPTNTAADFLKLSLIGGEFGVEPKEVNLTLYNKNGVTGAVFENNNLDVIDFGFKTLNEMQGNIRFENRTAYLDNGILNSPNGEFQFFDNPLLLETSADPEDWTYKTTFAIGRKKATLNTELSVVDDVTVESGVVNLTSSATVSFNATSKTIDFIFN